MRTLLVLVALSLAGSAHAKDDCVEYIPDKVWEQRRRDFDVAVARALKARGLQYLPLERFPSGPLPVAVVRRWRSLPDGGTTLEERPFGQSGSELAVTVGDVLEPAAADAGEPQRRIMFLAHVGVFEPEHDVFARDTDGNVFEVQLELTENPRRIVRSCSCGHSGHAPRPEWYAATVNEGDRFVYRNEPVTVPLKLRTVQVRYRQDRACGEIP